MRSSHAKLCKPGYCEFMHLNYQGIIRKKKRGKKSVKFVPMANRVNF